LKRGEALSSPVRRVFAASLFSGPLSREARRLLARFPRECFRLAKGERAGSTWEPACPGVLDLYSGSGSVGRSFVAEGAPWVLELDWSTPSCVQKRARVGGSFSGGSIDLSEPVWRVLVEDLIGAGAFRVVGAAPDCSSFSVAVTPPIRSSRFPGGGPWVTGKAAVKIKNGNSHARWMSKLAYLCDRCDVVFWLENPDSSWLFKQRCFRRLRKSPRFGFWRVDFCRFRAKWKKRTRVFCNIRSCWDHCLFCLGGHTHIRLRGMAGAEAWTAKAQASPPSFACSLARLVLGELALRLGQVNPWAGVRVGEASHPGPRPAPSLFLRQTIDLAARDRLSRPARIRAIAAWDRFAAWVASSGTDLSLSRILSCPSLLSPLLRSFGLHLYRQGSPLHWFVDTINACQERNRLLKHQVPIAWELVDMWREIEPVQSRPAMPVSILRAMTVVALMWGWDSVAVVLLLTFFCICRIGDSLKASRTDVITPSDLLELDGDSLHLFLAIDDPKRRKRGPKRQHASMHSYDEILFIDSWLRSTDRNCKIYPLSASSFRKRWDALLSALSISRDFGLTPGGLRGGGAVWEFTRSSDVNLLLWRMRLSNATTLSHYLQEVVARQIVARLPEKTRDKISQIQKFYLPLLRSKTFKNSKAASI